MIIFINDIPVKILKKGEQHDRGRINHIIDVAREEITPAKLINHVLIENVRDQDFNHLLDLLDLKVPTDLLSLVLSVNNYLSIKTHLRTRFKIVKAAGGLVRKKDKFFDDLSHEKVGSAKRKEGKR